MKSLKRNKTAWLLCMAALGLILYTIVASRASARTDVIFGSSESGFIRSDSASFVDPATYITPEPTVDIWPQIDITQSKYSLVTHKDPDHILNSLFEPDVAQIAGTTEYFDAAALPELEAMLQDLRDHAEEKGYRGVYVGSGYRTYSYQKRLFDGKATQIAMGLGVPVEKEMYLDPRYQEAVEEAKTITAYPGSSEHQLGLAVDLFDKIYYPPLSYSTMNQKFFDYLDSICYKYGFIKRYPTRKLLLTGWDEPWHYRYVGVEAATFITEQNLCYEEFYKHYDPDFSY